MCLNIGLVANMRCRPGLASVEYVFGDEDTGLSVLQGIIRDNREQIEGVPHIIGWAFTSSKLGGSRRPRSFLGGHWKWLSL